VVTDNDTREEFISRCEEVHGKYYNYSQLPHTFSKTEKVTIICPKHGKFTQTPDVHLRGSGCPKCKVEKVTQVTRSNKTDFIFKANKIHDFKFNYTNVTYVNAITPVTIICPKHGKFTQTPDVHLRGSGCPKCYSSSQIRTIQQTLDNHNILYVSEKTFAGCIGIGGKLLRFDIYIPEFNTCIEYDGPHHYRPTIYGGYTIEQATNNFKKQKQNDTIKNDFCTNNHIDLIRIPYTQNHPDATVLKYLNTKQPERFMYTWDDLSVDVKKIINYIMSFDYERFAVYGIKRGGIPFAIPVSYHFENQCELGIVTYQRYDNNDTKVSHDINHSTKDIPIFVIDDLISSGETMSKVVKSLQHKYKKAKIHPIVIFGDENEEGIFFIRAHPKQWIVFPYEAE